MSSCRITSYNVCYTKLLRGKAFDVTPAPAPMGREATRVITSYSIHYTKLYEEIANKGWQRASVENKEIRLGLNIVKGKVTFRGVADAFGLEYVDADTLICVITSYSIHYTKLYDARVAGHLQPAHRLSADG